jgi:hypothetical protein
LTGIAVTHSIRLFIDPTREISMFLFRVIRRAGLLISIAILIFRATKAFAADAPMSPAQIALYPGPDREKIILEGARKEGQLVFYNSHTWFKSVAPGV